MKTFFICVAVLAGLFFLLYISDKIKNKLFLTVIVVCFIALPIAIPYAIDYYNNNTSEELYISSSSEEYNSNNINDSDNESHKKTDEDNDEKGIENLGFIPCYYFDEKKDDYFKKDGKLYVKNVNDKEYFYVSVNSNGNKKYPVEKCSVNVNGHYCNGTISIDTYEKEISYFIHIQAWGDEEGKDIKKDDDKKEEKIVIEHHRDLMPVQEWIPCGGCGGSGQCGVCNGTGKNLYSSDPYAECISCNGMKKCKHCAGRGGHYETFYR